MTPVGGCPPATELARQSSLGLEPWLEEHLAGCPRCRVAWQAAESLRALAAALPAPAPVTPAAHDAARAELLARARLARAPRRPAPLAAAAAAAIVVVAGAAVAFAWLRAGDAPPAAQEAAAARVAAPARVTPPAPVERGTVHALGKASFARVSAQPDEIVRLVDGSLTVEVAHLGAGERFRVMTGDAEVEVRGTAFDITALDDHLSSVRVLRGRVEVRVSGAPAVELVAGQRWTRPAESPEPAPPAHVDAAHVDAAHVDAAHVDAPDVEAPRLDAGDATVVARGGDAGASKGALGESAYRAGWDALRAGDFPAAASAFDKALKQGSPELVEDASFWRAVALGRAGDKEGSTRALTQFLARYPRSMHAPEAAAIVGWGMIARGDLDGAAPLLRTASAEGPPAVRDRAQAGLDEIERLRRQPAPPALSLQTGGAPRVPRARSDVHP